MMDYILEYSPEAIRDLDDVYNDVFTASSSLEVTHKYLDELQDEIESLVTHPKTGTLLYYEDMFTGYYYIRFKEYLSFFRLEDNKMLVDRILFRKRDYIRILFGIKN